MGMYTELVVACRLAGTIPDEALGRLKRLVLERGNIDAIDYSGTAWPFAIGGSADFPCQNASLELDDFFGSYVLNIRMNRKNYHGEMESFLRWLHQYVVAGSGSHGLWASVHCDEDKMPTFYFLDNT